MGGTSGARTGKTSMAPRTADQMAWRAAALRAVQIAANAINARHNARSETSASCASNCKPTSEIPGISTSLLFAPRNVASEAMELAAVDHFVVHHADEQLFDRSAAETVDDLAHSAGGHVLRALGAGVDIGAAVHAMGGVTLQLQAAEDGAHGGIFHGAARRQSRAHLLRTGRAVRPQKIHHHVLENAEGLTLFIVTHCNVTVCNIRQPRCQGDRAGSPWPSPVAR